MSKKINLSSLPLQYLVGLVVNIVFVVILLSTDVSYRNLQLPEGEYQNNIWAGSDVMTYVRPARNYLNYGVFGRENVPDYHRTVGYPLYLALMMKLFGDSWHIWALFVQAILYASIYPALSKITQILFPEKPSLVVPAFCFFLISGAYFTRTPVLLTDLFFSVLFTIGVCFGLLSIVRQSWKYLFLHLIAIGYAAQVRPALILYPVVNVFVLWLVARRHGVSNRTRVKAMIVTSLAVLVLVCNAPSIRNYVHYVFFKPTDVFANGLFTYLGGRTMIDNGEQDAYEEMRKNVYETDNVAQRITLMEKYAMQICKKYPVTIMKQLIIYAAGNCLHSHLLVIPKYLGYNWRARPGERAPLKQSKLVFGLLVTWCVVYMLIWMFFLCYLLLLIKEREWLFLFTISMLVCYILIPTFVAGGGGRMRLPVEGIIVVCAFYMISQVRHNAVPKRLLARRVHKLQPRTGC